MRLCLLLLLAARCGDLKESEDSPPPIDVDGDGFVGEDDCDSEDPTIHIRAAEVCNGKDDNCDGLTDDATADDATTWYLDSDADGWGGLATTTACSAPSSYSAKGGDCDDADPSFHPEAPEEDCLDPRDFNCDGQIAYADADADGSPACVDCDDQDPERNPDAVERCNGWDDDCDGSTDEEGAEDTVWYPDQDADGYGDPAQPLIACAPPPGYVANGEDCNDAKASHHPGAEESNCADPQDYNCDGSVGSEDLDGDGFSACADCDDRQADVFPGSVESCNSIDDNCNGLVDEDEGAPTLWYQDQDNDGWGTDLVSTSSCLAPPGYVAEGGDCDDGSIRFHPGASERDCADPNDYNCDGSVGTSDGDADGYVACEDCNDSLSSVHPLAEEYCDQADNDCDGQTDEASAVDAGQWYNDLDHDGYGAGSGLLSCTAPRGYVSENTDCDDGRGSVSPGATEYCNSRDDNCDGQVDEDSAADARPWYLDADSDGFGDPLLSTVACSAPPGYTETGDDCDDSSADANPAATEVCDEQDNDCDGTVDLNATDALTVYRDADGDGSGDPALNLAACTAPEGYVEEAGDCDDSSSAIGPYATEYCDGVDNNCDGSTDGSDAIDPYLFYADADGDGYGDYDSPLESCTPPAGYVTFGEDCDDTDATIHPGAVEICDGNDGDEDCNGRSNDLDPNVVGTTYWFEDSDGDSYGGAAIGAFCDSPSALAVSLDGDCNDGQAEISPAAQEICDPNHSDEDCDGLSDNDDPSLDPSGSLSWYTDADGDGYGAGAVQQSCAVPSGASEQDGDCDDRDAAIHPGATEVCDAADEDEDCNGVAEDADPGLSTSTRSAFFADGDGDLYGGGSAVYACNRPAGHVSSDGDCNDSNRRIHPGATEVCDAADTDEDCDGLVEDADPSLDSSTGQIYYRDADDDGHGTPATTVYACNTPIGYDGPGDDCDDQNPDVYPGAPERCDAANLDEDCNGLADDADPNVVTASLLPWYQDSDGDGYGSYSALSYSCEAPSGSVPDGGDCNDSSTAQSPGQVEVCDAANLDEDCDGWSDNADPDVDLSAATLWYADQDADLFGDPAVPELACDAPTAFVANSDDCDDGDAGISPSQTEVCDAANTDEDCDGSADDADASLEPFSRLAWYADSDADGYGDANVELLACDAPAGSVADASDCDDSRDNINPAAIEVCDEGQKDEDCDGAADDADDGTDPSTFAEGYADADLDGFGDPNSPGAACILPAGYVSSNTDCDDTDSSINPNGQELCDAAEVDEDCDALINDEDPSLSAGSIPPWYTDADGDSYGDPAASLYACSQPAGAVANGDDCLDSDAAVNPGAAEVCNDSLDNNCSGADECVRSGLVFDLDADAGYLGLNAGGSAATGSLGSSVLGGDLNGDGYSDLILADRLYDSGTTTANIGRVYVLQGGATGVTATLASPTAVLSGPAAGDRLGQGVAVLPDLDQDGDAELLVGSYLSNTPATDAGSVYLFAGPLSGAVGVARAHLTVTGAATTDYLGWQVQPAGDINDDGTEDWAVSAYFSGSPGTRPGKVGLVSGGSSGSFSISSASMLGVISGSGNERLGASLSRGFDADGDGITDLATTSLGSGTVYLYSGPLSGSMAATAYDSSITGLSWTATGGGETQSPQALAAPGDTDGDGYEDLLVGSDGNDSNATDAGAAWLFAGPVAGSLSTTDATAALYGTTTLDYTGRAVAGAGDANGDGLDDLLVGLPGYDPLGTNEGAVLLLYGPFSGSYTTTGTLPPSAALVGTESSGAFGTTLGGVGDLDADGFADWAIAANSSNGTARVGGVYLYYGLGE